MSASGTEVKVDFDWTAAIGGATNITYQLVAWNETGAMADGDLFAAYNWNGTKVSTAKGQSDYLVFNDGTVSGIDAASQASTTIDGINGTTVSYSTTFDMSKMSLDADHDNLDDYEYIGIRFAMTTDELAAGGTLNNISVAIPEPGTFSMLGLGATGLLLLRRRRA